MLPIAAIKRISKNANIKRISKDALKEIQKYMNDLAGEIVIDIAEVARHSGRKTITKQDVRIAVGKN